MACHSGAQKFEPALVGQLAKLPGTEAAERPPALPPTSAEPHPIQTGQTWGKPGGLPRARSTLTRWPKINGPDQETPRNPQSNRPQLRVFHPSRANHFPPPPNSEFQVASRIRHFPHSHELSGQWFYEFCGKTPNPPPRTCSSVSRCVLAFLLERIIGAGRAGEGCGRGPGPLSLQLCPAGPSC